MGIATILLEHKLITNEQLELALSEQKSTGERLDRALVRLGMISPRDVTRAISEQFSMPIVDLTGLAVQPDVLETIPAQVVFKQNCVPIARSTNNGHPSLRVATSDPFEITVFDELRLLTGCEIELVLAEEEELHAFIRRHFGVAGDTLDAMSQRAGEQDLDTEAPVDDEMEAAQEASVIRLVNDLLVEAITSRATDVHIEPYEHQLIVRYRVDGVLGRATLPPTIHRFGNAIVSRIKIMANLNIAEKRRPQDGRITLRHKGASFDLRVSVIPMLFGEGIVLRILNKSAVLMGLDDLGMPDTIQTTWDTLIEQPYGILLVTGPTGSGKSTTLYASLNRIVSDEIKVITVEDPVEYHVGGINQIQVSHKVGLDFAAGLRSILRHDPDVVMIGEIRDRETAEAAIQASLTGHLVFSTLHTNDAASAITRLADLGIERFLITSTLAGAMAQRLVRRICEHCITDRFLNDDEVRTLRLSLPKDKRIRVREGAGCHECRGTGYLGRTGIFEVLAVDHAIKDLILAGADSPEIKREAAKNGMRSLRQSALRKLAEGATTYEEVVRVTSS
ncbi:MAG: Flp pilus assembly complex ATPase component TadA [Acidobacteria bacterium]|nr:Flp pilus assembly complex ATPase component TadA [Acidobacteriota bacterium]